MASYGSSGSGSTSVELSNNSINNNNNINSNNRENVANAAAINTNSKTINDNNNNNNHNNNNNNNNNNNAVAGGANANEMQHAGASAILIRLKEIEATNQSLQATIDRLKTDAQNKEEKIKDLSSEKRKDMERMIETAIDNWLNSLTEVSDDVRKQFRHGITKIAEQADMKNAAWEIVCNASSAHCQRVDKINELIKTVNEQGETIKSLLGGDPSFSSEESRMAGGGVGSKRTRQNDSAHDMPPPQAKIPHYGSRVELNNGGGGSASNQAHNHDSNQNNSNSGDAWDLFSQMMKQESRTQYY